MIANAADTVRPRYDRDWIGGVVPAVLSNQRPGWLPERGNATATVVLVLDGLGSHLLREFAELAPTLSGMTGSDITSVAPSTTVSALTSITTGATPAEHGMLGYRFRVGGQILAPLRWSHKGRGADPSATFVQPVQPFSGASVAVVARGAFRATGFTQAHLRGARFYSCDGGLAQAVLAALEEEPALIYAYDDRIDKAAHAEGLDSAGFAAALSAADTIVADLLQVLPPSVELLITADHGQLRVDPGQLMDLGELTRFVSAMSGEARFRSLHAATGALGELQQIVCSRYAAFARVLTRDELCDSGLLGGQPTLSVRARIGDLVLIAKGSYGFIDPDYRKEAGVKTMHGGLSPEEMLVPLLVRSGSARSGVDIAPARR